MNWAIETGNGIDYIEGHKAASAEEAEREWRQFRRLFFIPVMVRRTTADEDERLTQQEQP